MTNHIKEHWGKWLTGTGGLLGAVLAAFAILGVWPADITAIPKTNTMVVEHQDRLGKLESWREAMHQQDLNLLGVIKENTDAVNNLALQIQHLTTMQGVIIKDLGELER